MLPRGIRASFPRRTFLSAPRGGGVRRAPGGSLGSAGGCGRDVPASRRFAAAAAAAACCVPVRYHSRRHPASMARPGRASQARPARPAISEHSARPARPSFIAACESGHAPRSDRFWNVRRLDDSLQPHSLWRACRGFVGKRDPHCCFYHPPWQLLGWRLGWKDCYCCWLWLDLLAISRMLCAVAVSPSRALCCRLCVSSRKERRKQ